MVGQLIHGNLPARRGKAGRMMPHGSPEALRISQQILPEIIAVLLHSCQKPGNRLHKGIIVHDGIPFIPLQPVPRISVMLRQNNRFRVCLLYSLPELLPEIMVKFLAVTQICRHIQSPAIRTKGRGNPLFADAHHIIHQLLRAFII